jgi:hypothetical protein
VLMWLVPFPSADPDAVIQTTDPASIGAGPPDPG